jgi:hypothetical protein
MILKVVLYEKSPAKTLLQGVNFDLIFQFSVLLN